MAAKSLRSTSNVVRSCHHVLFLAKRLRGLATGIPLISIYHLFMPQRYGNRRTAQVGELSKVMAISRCQRSDA